MINVIARLVARPDRIPQLAEIFRQLVPPTRREAGCMCYEVYQGEADSTVFVTFEQWHDAAAVEAHMASTHVQQAFAAAADVLAAAPEIKNYIQLA